MTRARTPARRRSNTRRPRRKATEQVFWVLAAATVVALAVWPVLGVAGGAATLAWLVVSWRTQMVTAHYPVPTLRELRARAPFPIRGKPGRYAQRLSMRATGTIVAVALLATLAAAGSAWYGLRFGRLPGHHGALGVPVAIAVGALAGFLRPAPWVSEASRARAGIRHELLAVELLTRIPGIAEVVLDYLPPGRHGDLDVLVTTDTGAVAGVEVKSGRGRLELRGGDIYAGGRHVGVAGKRSAIEQVEATSAAAADALGCTVTPVVLLPRASGQLRNPDTGTWITGGEDLTAVIEHIRYTAEGPRIQTPASNVRFRARDARTTR